MFVIILYFVLRRMDFVFFWVLFFWYRILDSAAPMEVLFFYLKNIRTNPKNPDLEVLILSRAPGGTRIRTQRRRRSSRRWGRRTKSSRTNASAPTMTNSVTTASPRTPHQRLPSAPPDFSAPVNERVGVGVPPSAICLLVPPLSVSFFVGLNASFRPPAGPPTRHSVSLQIP